MRIRNGLLALGLVGALASLWLGATREPSDAPTTPRSGTLTAEPTTAREASARPEASLADLVAARGSADAAAKPTASAERIPSDTGFARVRSTLADALAAHLPDVRLSEDELDDLARATLRMREARATLRGLPKRAEHAEERADARERLADAIADFTYVLRMTPDEFTRRVEPDGGVDAWDGSEPVGPIETRLLEDRGPRA